jgi:hypothetical protein
VNQPGVPTPARRDAWITILRRHLDGCESLPVHASADAVYDNVVRGIDALKELGFRTFKYVKVR